MIHQRTVLLTFAGWILLGVGLGSGWTSADEPNVAVVRPELGNLQRDKLVAWCVVPFDAAHRSPEQRAQMLDELGLKHLAYDWREEHVASWDAEIDALKRHNIELTGWWCAGSLDPLEDAGVQRIVDFVKRRGVHTQLWLSLPDG
ncbi:MAG: hypothetical protein ABI557_15755, partial [Aureliella sp.]